MSNDVTYNDLANAPRGLDGGNPSGATATRPLRILAVSQHYWPEPFNIPDVCEGLVQRGHEVTVLTGTPNYPEGRIYPGYEHGARREEEHHGVAIRRVWLIPRRRDPVHRVLNYYSFSGNASRAARSMDPGFDVVLAFQTSPVMMARPALAYGKRHGVPVLLYCMDIWPECLTVGGIKRDSAVFAHYKRVSMDIYSSADRLAITSPRFADYFKSQLGIEGQPPLYLPQYAEHVFDGKASRIEGAYDPEKLNLTFAGNVGKAQSIDTLVKAASLLVDDERFVFHVVGSGSELENVKRLRDKLGAGNVVFHGRRPFSEMPSYYASSDAMVATFFNGPMLPYTLPRKMLSYMAAGRPILGAVSGEARNVTESARCGLCCDVEDAQGLALICREFAEMPVSEREELGARGRAYYEAHYSRERFFNTLENELYRLRDGVIDAC